MGNIDWTWFLIGVAVGYVAVPYVMGAVRSVGSKAKA